MQINIVLKYIAKAKHYPVNELLSKLTLRQCRDHEINPRSVGYVEVGRHCIHCNYRGASVHQMPQAPLLVGTDFVTPSAAVRDLGIHLDSDMSMNSTSGRQCRLVSLC